LLSCGDGGTGPSKSRIGTEGGVVSFLGGSVTLTVPPDALSEFVEFTAIQTDEVPNSDLLVSGSAYEIGPAGTFFAESATLTLSYDPAGVPDGVVESELRLHRVVGSGWGATQHSTVDIDRHEVSGSLHGLSRFGVLGVSVSSVDVSPTFFALGAGERKQISATAKGPSGELLASRMVTWTSSDEAVATVDPMGWVTALGVGSATITAAVESYSASVTIDVYDCESQSQIPGSECQALISLYDASTEWGWRDSRNWVSGPNPCEWRGVTCTDGSVSRLFVISETFLTGSIPQSLTDLSNLNTLRLWGRLSGSIPSSIGSLAKLDTLDLGGNELSGPIPPSLGQLNTLRDLRLHWNSLSGSIPPEFGALSNVTYMRLDGNELSGPIPPELGNMSSLVDITLLDNQLSGSIPPALGNLSNLESLGLSVNQLSGSIPGDLGNLSNLKGLFLRENQLTGALPAALGNLTKLENIQLYGNQLAGVIPLPVAQLGGRIQAAFPLYNCDFLPGNTGLSMPDTQDYRDADLDGDGKICYVPIGAP
jgi:hypothetical protein